MALLNTAMMNIFTLPLSIAFPTPSHYGSMVLCESWFIQWLGQHVCWLIRGVDGMQHDFSMFNIVPEVMELDVDVLGVWVHLWDLSDFEGSAVVLKDMAMNSWLGGDHVEALALDLFD